MKDYKIILISFILLIFMIGAVSANDADNLLTDDDPGAFIPEEPIIGDDDESNIKEIYVNDTGDDSNEGSINSPYATIGRAVEDVTEADEAVIYIGEGTYATDGDSNFNIYMSHQYNGNANLKFIGAGADKTIIDGQSTFKFAHFEYATNITLKDITFVNFRGDGGGVVSSVGILNVENCVFKDCYSTSGTGGAISSGWDDYNWDDSVSMSLNVKNSQFISCSVNSEEGWSEQHGGGAIFAGGLNEVCLENNTFVSTSVSENWGNGAAVFSWMSNSKIINNKFINITGYQMDAALYCDSYMGVEVEIINNTFINCCNALDEYAVVYLGFSDYNLENNTFIDSANSAGECYYTWNLESIQGLKYSLDEDVINVGNTEINNGAPISVSVTDDNENKFKLDGGGDFQVNFANENNSYTFTVSNNKIDFEVVPENGIYNLSIGDSDVLGIVNVNATSDPIDLYVSPEGSDADEGTADSPFATIQHAIDVGFEKSFNVVVHLLKGTYSDEGNVELIISNKGNLQLIGEAYNETVIDGNNMNWFMSVGTTNVIAQNLKFINGKSNDRYSVISCNNLLYYLCLKDCIVDSNEASGNSYVISNVLFDNLVYTNNKGTISLVSSYDDIVVANSYFANNNCSDNTYGVLYLDCYYNSILVENCTFINNTAKEGAAFKSQRPFTSRNNYYEGNTALKSAAISVGTSYEAYLNFVFENDTFINNKATAGNGGVIGIGKTRADLIQSFNFTNCKFINNSAVKGGAIALINGNIKDCEFINNTADNGGAILIVPYFEVYYGINNNGINFTDVKFDNNIANVNGHDMYFDDKNTASYYDLFTLTFNCNDLNVSSYSDTLTINVSAPCNAIIGGGIVDLELNGSKIATTEIVNGIVSYNYSGFEDGVYVFSAKSRYGDNSTTFTNATINVKLEGIVDNITYWVSNEGSDENGNGNEVNPFKSISYAINKASKASRDIVINIAEGTYTGDLNTALELSSMYNMTLAGAGADKTIIDGENTTYFATVTDGSRKVTVSDLTIKNMLPDNRKSLTADSSCPITIIEGGNLYLNNVEMVDNHGGSSIISSSGILTIDNSVFRRNGFTQAGVIGGGNVTINNCLFEDNFAESGLISANNLIINNSEIKNAYTISSDIWAYSLSFDVINYKSGCRNNVTIENTVISNDGSVEDLNALGVNTQGKFVNPALAVNGNLNMVNCTMANNYNGTLYTDAQVADLEYLSVLGYSYGQSRVINVVNSSFYNYQYIWVSNDGYHNFTFDGCLFTNLEYIAFIRNVWETSAPYDFNNCVFLNCTPVILYRHSSWEANPTKLNFNDNYWGNNTPDITIQYLGTNGIRPDTYSPETWIALYSEDGETIIKNVTDGENSTAYTGNAPIRTDYADNNGALDYAVVFGDVGYLFTTDEDKNVIFNLEDAIYPFEAADPMNYRTPSFIVITGFDGDNNIVGMLVDPVGNPISNATITSTFTGAEPVNITTDENGTFKVKAGKNGILNIVYAGDDIYFDSEYNLTFKNAGKTTESFIIINTINDDLVVQASLVDDEGTPIANASISCTIGNETFNTTTDANGVFEFNGISNGTVLIVFEGSETADAVNATLAFKDVALAPVKVESHFDIENRAITITGYAVDTPAGEEGMHYATTLLDANGNPIADAYIEFAVNNKIYNRTTYENGSFDAYKLSMVRAGRYTMAFSFAGDENYTSAFACVCVDLEKKPISIKASAKSYKASVKTKKYTVTLSTIVGSSHDGKVHMSSGMKVTLTVNGKTYTAKTNAKGQATFKITGLSKKGKYTAKISYEGDKTYDSAAKSVKLTIK